MYRVFLSKYDKLHSEKDAKDIISLFDTPRILSFDFYNIEEVGVGFIRYIFQYYRKNNPQVNIAWSNANKHIDTMITDNMNSIQTVQENMFIFL